jgi:adenylyltransferase/sulfurtransferase
MTAVILPGRTPCLRCVFPDSPPPGSLETCETSGIIAPAATMVASLEVVEALKMLAAGADAVRRTWLSVELWPFRIVELGGSEPRPRDDCRCCGRRELDFLNAAAAPRAESLCGRDAVHVTPRPGAARVHLDELARRLAPLARVRRLEYVLVIPVGQQEITLFDDGRALVKGTSEPAVARSLYDRWVGS